MKTREHYTDSEGKTRLRCGGCGEFKQSKDFNKSYSGFMELTSKCKACRSEDAKIHYQKNSDKYKSNSKNWKANNADKVRGYSRDRYRRMTKKVREIYDNSIKKRNEKYGFNTNSLNYKAIHFINKHLLRPTFCPICGENIKPEFHHVSYENEEMWSIGVFCCKRCHEKIHSGDIQGPGPINLLDLIE